MIRRTFLSLCSAFIGLSAMATVQAEVYELRTYTTLEGRMPQLLKRFEDHTCALFEKHGMTNVIYWTPLRPEDGANTQLIYLLKHASKEAAATSFSNFVKDPAWISAHQASEKDGPILAKAPESLFLDVADISPALAFKNSSESRIFEMRIYRTQPNRLKNLHQRFANHTISLFSKHGMKHIGYFTPTDDEHGKANTLIYWLSHKSPEAAAESFKQFRSDPVWIAAKTASEKEGSITLDAPHGVKSVLLKTTSFSPIQ